MAVKVIDQPTNVTLCRQTDVYTAQARACHLACLSVHHHYPVVFTLNIMYFSQHGRLLHEKDIDPQLQYHAAKRLVFQITDIAVQYSPIPYLIFPIMFA